MFCDVLLLGKKGCLVRTYNFPVDGFIIFTLILVMILHVVLQRFIGLYFSMISAWSSFGTGTNRVSFSESGIFISLKIGQ